jgi:hypothetical protein
VTYHRFVSVESETATPAVVTVRGDASSLAARRIDRWLLVVGHWLLQKMLMYRLRSAMINDQ